MFFNTFFKNFQTLSIKFKFGEYGGKKSNFIHNFSTKISTSFA
jgi:hypothetical protein